MRHSNPGRIAIVTTMLLAALAFTGRTDANGAANIDKCQSLDISNTTYRLTRDLASADSCLIVAANKVTIDMQGHSIMGSGEPDSNGITDLGHTYDVIVIKNGAISGYTNGIFMQSNRVSVIGVTATSNEDGMTSR